MDKNTEMKKSACPVAKQPKDDSGIGDVACREEEILAFWNAHDIFNKSVEKDAPHGDFVFYDGPPFATGTPHYGHILAGTIKDAIPRFWTMNGKRVVRKWGWDCHGLPLENIIEKRLGLATKRDIEAMGVKQFNEAARGAVLEYEEVWKEVVPRMGRFVDMEDDYKTMDATYTESVWWVFAELNRKGLVYEGFKSMHLCPRCGTTLSNFEVNLGYKDIKDIAVTVKLPLLDPVGNDAASAISNGASTSLLVWTTTPWTLPGNMAAAVHKDIEYVKVKVTLEEKVEIVILAKARLAQLGTDRYEILETMKGSSLVGKTYLPPFDSFKNQELKNKEHAWKIYHADYVELGEEGTGAVHLAPAYGEEDMELAKREGVPIVHHVDVDGRFKDFVAHLAGQLVKPKDDDKADVSHLDADIEIVKLLKDSGKLFKKENITHSYPHCWRCDTPLLNYATTSWFVRVTDIKDKLVEENNKVHWVPEHVGSNRFGRWLEGARDWAISRQRYWGAPLPIWRNETTKEYKIFGSLAELQKYIPKSGNTFLLTRHGESELNTKGVLNGKVGVKNGLTEAGTLQVQKAAEALQGQRVDYIYHSPLERTTATAKIFAQALDVPEERIIVDARILEMQFGEFEGSHIDEYHSFFGSGENRLRKAPEGGETWTDVKRRAGAFLYEINAKHQNARILIVSHNGTMQMVQAAANGDNLETTGRHIDEDSYDLLNAEVREFSFIPLPHNDEYELDFHRPYIDEIELFDEDGTKLMRVPDVFDCWFESGSMPYAQNHYPFENLEKFDAEKDRGFPADFIAEALDQTRGWFYSLMVLGTALFGKSPYENVIVTGLVLAEDGKKMSKSLQNYPDPMELANRVGVDAMRFYLLTSPLMRGEDFNFSEKEILELQRKNLGRLHNVLAMYEMYAPVRADVASATSNGAGDVDVVAGDTSNHVLDRWIVSRTHEVLKNITDGYTNYELDKATRPIEGLIDDISVWYLRRSRERLKSDNEEDKKMALGTLRYVLKMLSLMMAPVMPFYAEYLFLRVREERDAESVHLMAWPKSGVVDSVVLDEMKKARVIVSLALEARSKQNIKVRQPLSKLVTNIQISEELQSVVEDEVNVKEVVCEQIIGTAPITANGEPSPVVTLDTEITPELKLEGEARELMRAIQDARKEMGLKAEDRIILLLDETTKLLVESFEREVLRTVGARFARADKQGANRSLLVGDTPYHFGIVLE